jgi:Protein of unknown function (DUF3465)
LLAGVGGYTAHQYSSQNRGTSGEPNSSASSARIEDADAISRAFDQRQSNVQVQGSGLVERVLADDSDGSRHQRFIVRLASGQTVLIAHNIDLAPRVTSLAAGDRVEFYGEYEWNDRGGVIHWTHRDPQGRHEAGWIKRGGDFYQ